MENRYFTMIVLSSDAPLGDAIPNMPTLEFEGRTLVGIAEADGLNDDSSAWKIFGDDSDTTYETDEVFVRLVESHVDKVREAEAV